MNPFARLKRQFVLWVWNHTPSCAEIARLTSRALEQPLPLTTRLKLRLHFVICVWCRRYFEQIDFLHQAAPKLGVRLGELPGRGLTSEARERIKTQVRKHFITAM